MEKKDYFISYNSADEKWAEWIASVLKENNYTVIIQAWDFRPGANFVLEMHKAALNTKKTIIVLSDNYLQAEYTQPEWATAFSEDPQGNDRKLIPVRVKECKPNGLLRPIVYINIFNLEETRAEVALLEGLKRDVRPKTRTRFPGGERIGEKKCKENLISKNFKSLIGRSKELKLLLERISSNYTLHINEVVGIGGLGKTALVLEAAYLCKQAKENGNQINKLGIPIFDAIVYTSAKSSYLQPVGIKDRCKEVPERCLQDIFHTISTTLENPIIIQATAKDQLNKVYKCLANQRTLLIIDNMETLERSEKDKIYAFLADLPRSTQAIITTRERLGFDPISLEELSQEDSLELIEQEARDKDINISDEDANKLYERFNGIPLALKYTIGKIAYVKRVDFNKPLDENIALFCFEESVSLLRGHYSHKLLMALALFPGTSTKESLIEVAGLSSQNYIQVETAIDQLIILNLIDEDNGKYHMLTITKEYTKLEINQDIDFKNAARERLIILYLQFTKKYGGLDWKQWLFESGKIQEELENIKGILDWCAKENRYEDVKIIWTNISNYIDLLGDWQLCLYWTDWLIRQSDIRSELETYISFQTNKAWILILMGGNKLNEARILLKEAWKFRKCATLHVRIEIAKNLGVLNMHLNNYSHSIKWFARAEEFLNQANLTNREYYRFKILFTYYLGRVEYFRQNYEVAQKFFKQVVDLGDEIGWQRYSNYAEHRLGDVAMEMGDLPKARVLLEKAYLLAQKNSEPRRVFLCLMSLAKLEKKSNNLTKACNLELQANALKSNSSVSTKDEEDFNLLHDELGCELIPNTE